MEGNFHSLSYILSLEESAFISFNLFYLKGMDSSDSEVSLCESSTSSSCNNSIHIDEYNINSSTMNRESNLPLSPNPKDHERSTDERRDEEFQINKESQLPLIPNPMDYESSSDGEHDEEFQKNGVSWCPLSPNPMDYERSGDEEFQKNGVSRCPLSPNAMDYETNSDEEHDE